MDHPYKSAPDRAFWKRAFGPDWTAAACGQQEPLVKRGERVASAGSCFAANIVPFLERAGFDYVRTDAIPPVFADVAPDNFNYGRFSAAYGNIYTARQAVQMLQRALGRFRPLEDRWALDDGLIVDPFRPGLRYPAASHVEFDLLTEQHLRNVLSAVRAADVFIFTLGLTEAWISTDDGAVFPACPGTVSGNFDPSRHVLRNFTARDVAEDLESLIDLLREIHPGIRVVLTVSPVPLVATATTEHVLIASTYSKSVLRVAAGEVSSSRPNVAYFPAYEIVTGPQAPFDFFKSDRREPSDTAISAVMVAFLAQCEYQPADAGCLNDGTTPPVVATANKNSAADDFAATMSALNANAQCEEAAAGL